MKINFRENILVINADDLDKFKKSVKESEYHFTYRNFIETQFIIQGYNKENIKDYKVVVSDGCIGGEFEKQLQDFAKNLQAVMA